MEGEGTQVSVINAWPIYSKILSSACLHTRPWVHPSTSSDLSFTSLKHNLASEALSDTLHTHDHQSDT